ncbi:MAG: SpoIIE family protein phosphatase [Leptospiraceae bacterium]|nr:SpoIIE family protein phosphatase [Leptospiraceae bacterium]
MKERLSKYFQFIGIFLILLASGSGIYADNIQRKAYILPYQGQELPDDAILNSKNAIPFINGEVHLGYLKKNIWVKVQFQNPFEEDRRFFLNAAAPSVDTVILYRKNGQNVFSEIYRSGDSIPHHKWPVNSPEIMFPLTLQPSENAELLMSAKSSDNLILRSTILTEKEFFRYDHSQRAIIFIYLGMLVALALYNMFLFFAVRSSTYISYFAMVLGIGMYTLTLSGYGFEVMWPNLTHWNSRASDYGAMIAIFAGTFFSVRYLQQVTLQPRFARFMLVPGILAIAGLIWFSLPIPNIGFSITGLLVIASLIIFLTAGVLSLKGGYHPARYFLAAWSVLIISIAIYTGRSVGIFPVNLFTQYSIFAGSAVAVTLLSMGLGDRLRVLERDSGHMTTQLQLARQIQNSLLPESAPDLKGLQIAFDFEPMMQVGGDFLDIIEFDERRIGVFICDVSGHGVPAALLAAMIKVALHTRWQREFRRPEAVLTELHNNLRGKLGGHFLTAFLIHLDLDDGRVSVARAGHDPAYRVTSAGEVLPLHAPGRLMADFIEPKYVGATYQLTPGDLVFICTDGVSESMDPDGKPFGQQRLTYYLAQQRQESPASLIQNLRSKLRSFRGGNTTNEDDITLIAMKYTGKTI